MSVGRELVSYVDQRKERLIEILRDLVRMPSENRAPSGAEAKCQEYIARVLQSAGWKPVVYSPLSAPEIVRHPMFWPGRNYEGRPNIGARRTGSGGGRSLVLSGHVDTVPAGSASWTHGPFSGDIDRNRLYGRGSNDMKAGVASNLFVAEAVAVLGLELKGDLIFESVVDEEFGGVNGTLAGRLMGFNGDAAIISEPTALRIAPAQRGGRMLHITFRASNQGILSSGAGAGVIDQLRAFLNALPHFASLRDRIAPRHALYGHLQDRVPVTVARIQTAPWGTSEPPNVPDICRLELFWQAMPGESVTEIDAQFSEWFEDLLRSNPSIFRERPLLEHPIRWLPGSVIDPSSPVVTELSEVAHEALGFQPPVQGIEGPCDMFAFHEFGVPTVLWGPRGGNTHMPDEYVEIDSLIQSTKVLLAFACSWCGSKQ